jgi:ribosomal protein S18 acetylase RimI-like enzyme
MTVTLRAATLADVPLLAAMNQQLIQDEGHRNRMTLPQLETRMRAFLAGEYRALVICQGSGAVGYALYRTFADEYPPFQPQAYLRQFFVCREQRRRQIGRAAMELLLRDHLPAGARVELEVLEQNAAARRFYAALGFRDYCVTMCRELPGGG